MVPPPYQRAVPGGIAGVDPSASLTLFVLHGFPLTPVSDYGMDVRSIEDVAPEIEHNGTVPVWWLVRPRELFEITRGGHLELVSEFEVVGGGLVDPHQHPTHEFYYVTSGRGMMTIEGEDREIRQGDLVHIPPNAVHSLRPVTDNASIRCFCFAVGEPDADPINYTSH
jgi:quercetin dioxygenase-like cupin family protein